MKSESFKIGGICFNSSVFKMKKSDFLAAYKNEQLWDKVQELKPKPKTRPKKKKSD